MALQITQLYSETAGNRPQVENVGVGQLWINAGDSVIGTKKNDGSLVTYAQFSESEKASLMPKSGQVADVTASTIASATETDAATIDDDSNIVLAGTMTANPFVVSISKTTAHKATKLIISKPQGVTSSISWNGVDLWLIGEEAPQFGDTEDAQELCVGIFTSPTKVAVNVIYNTEHPVEVEGGGAGAWGEIEGTLSNQTDLQAALDAKANASDLSNYIPVTGGAITGNLTVGTGPTTQVVISDQGGMTYGGDEVATVNQIPDVSNFATQAQLQQYVPISGGTLQGTLNVNTPTEDTNAANKGYVDDSIEALNVSQYATNSALTSGLAAKADADDLDNYLPVAGGTITGALSVQPPTASAHASTKQYVDTAISNLNISQYATTEALTEGLAGKADNSDLNTLMPKSGGAFTGAITVQTPTAANHPATKAYVDSATSRVYRSCGSVANEEALPSSGNQNGDVYNVEKTGMNYVWDGTKWDALGSFVDLSGYVTKTTADSTYLGKTAKAASATTADKATVLANSRTITLTGDATGSATFNGGANASIAVTVTHADAADTATSANSATSATTATTLATARTFRTNLASTSTASFNGGGNCTPGVTGTLGTANGGTGRTDGKAVNVTQVVTLSAVGPLGYTSSNGQYLTTSAAIAYWNGRYSGSSSNLQYCKTGTIIGSNGGTITGNLTVNGTLAGGSLSATSDRRLKDVHGRVGDVDLSSLSAYRYTFKNDENHVEHIDLIAQEVESVVPEAVKEIDDEGHLGIEYNALVAILIEKINILEHRINQLEGKI